MSEEIADAIRHGDSGRLRLSLVQGDVNSEPINYISGPYLPALNILVESEHLSEDEKIAFSNFLLKLGANPRRGAYLSRDAITVAERLKMPRLSRHLKEEYLKYGPCYVRDARKQDIKDIQIFYSKADGFVFRVADFDYPFYVGGDYDGAYPVVAAAVSGQHLQDYAQEKVEWFERYKGRIARGRKISLRSLLRHGDRIKVYKETDRANWDYGFR